MESEGRGQIHHGDSEFFLCPTLKKMKKKQLSLFLYQAQKLSSFLFYLQDCLSRQ